MNEVVSHINVLGSAIIDWIIAKFIALWLSDVGRKGFEGVVGFLVEWGRIKIWGKI